MLERTWRKGTKMSSLSRRDAASHTPKGPQNVWIKKKKWGGETPETFCQWQVVTGGGGVSRSADEASSLDRMAQKKVV
jgi:hypothetical protein